MINPQLRRSPTPSSSTSNRDLQVHSSFHFNLHCAKKIKIGEHCHHATSYVRNCHCHRAFSPIPMLRDPPCKSIVIMPFALSMKRCHRLSLVILHPCKYCRLYHRCKFAEQKSLLNPLPKMKLNHFQADAIGRPRNKWSMFDL